jgi:hypothetical protein
MYNLDSFTYWKDPAVRIKRIGIYPLDDAGKTQYYSKNSFIHHYLKRQIPEDNLDFPDNEPKNDINEEQKEEISLKESKKTIKNLKATLPNEDANSKTILYTEPNEGPIKIDSPINLKNNTLSTNIQNNLEKRFNLLEKKKKLRLNKINNDFQSKSLSQNKYLKNPLLFGKTNYNTISTNKRKMGQSFEKKARLTGLKIFPNKIPKINPKLPLIMERCRNENKNIIKIIKTETKEMGENYNPYNFIVPHVNRTKRNIFGSLFHS